LLGVLLVHQHRVLGFNGPAVEVERLNRLLVNLVVHHQVLNHRHEPGRGGHLQDIAVLGPGAGSVQIKALAHPGLTEQLEHLVAHIHVVEVEQPPVEQFQHLPALLLASAGESIGGGSIVEHVIEVGLLKIFYGLLLIGAYNLLDFARRHHNLKVLDDFADGFLPAIVPVVDGGTGIGSLTDHGILLGSGTSAITPLGVASNGQIPIGSAGADPVLAAITGTTDHISIANGAGSITVDLDTNTKTLLGSFNGMFLEKIDFTISKVGETIIGSLEQDSGGDLIQRFSDGYTTLDCTPALTINLTAYVGTNAVPKEVYVYILQSAKTVMAASNSDWPATEHAKIAKLVLKSAVTTGTDGGAYKNQNWNDYASGPTNIGHLLHVAHRLRHEPAQH
ncbi:hypothetical protein LCGC14_2874560, partial [marine sediment metagenome]